MPSRKSFPVISCSNATANASPAAADSGSGSGPDSVEAVSDGDPASHPELELGHLDEAALLVSRTVRVVAASLQTEVSELARLQLQQVGKENPLLEVKKIISFGGAR